MQCFTCNSDLLVEDSADRITCTECGEGQYVACPCCVDPSSNQRFTVKLLERYVQCALCRSTMIRLPCCNLFQPEMKVDRNLFECVQCAKYSIAYTCATINNLPPKLLRWECTHFHCNQFIVHCNCGRITYQDLKNHYKCPCGFEYEYDVEIGLKRC